MLRIIFGETEGAMHVPSWFRFNYEEEWFEDPLVAEIMADVDKSYYKGNQFIVNDELYSWYVLNLSKSISLI